MRRLSDGAIKVCLRFCLHGPRASGEFPLRHAEPARSLGKSRSVQAHPLTELPAKGVSTIGATPPTSTAAAACVFGRSSGPIAGTAPTPRPSGPPTPPTSTACERCSSRQPVSKCIRPRQPAPRAQWLRHGIPVETVRRAIEVGSLRKSCTMIDQPHAEASFW